MKVEINEVDVRDFKLFLTAQGNDAKKILVRSINRALPGVRTDAKDEIAKVTTLKKSIMHKHMTIKKAYGVKPIGIFDTTSKPIPLINYSARMTKKGVTVQVLKSSSNRALIRHAFVATMKSGHKGVFWREAEDFPRIKFKSGVSYGALPRKFRLPITERYGPRVSDFLGEKTLMAKVMDKSGTRWVKAMDYEVTRFMNSNRNLFD